jgi:hypothetical protein
MRDALPSQLRTELLLRELLANPVRWLAETLRLSARRSPPSAAEGERNQALRLHLQLRNGLARRRRKAAAQRLRQFPAFRAADYLALNPDIAWLARDPAGHALFRGACAGRPLFRREALARTLGEFIAAGPSPPAPFAADLAPLVARAPRVGVYVSSQGNAFMRDIALDLAAALTAAGVCAAVHDETGAPRDRPPLAVIVAPHEFFMLGRGPEWIREEVMASALMLNTEQVQTQWFTIALPFLLSARGVIDLCSQMRDMFAAAGVPSLQLTLAPSFDGSGPDAADRRHPLFRVLPQRAQGNPDPSAPVAERPLDIAFFGAASPHRDRFFTRHAAFFAAYETFLYCRRIDRGPIRAHTAEASLSRLAAHVGGHSKLVLNLHRDEFGYFEWHRIVRLGMSMGAVVVSEPCLPNPAFQPGTHYFEENARQLPNLIEWLLRSPEGRARAQSVQDNTRRLLAAEFSAERNAARVLALLLDGAGTA